MGNSCGIPENTDSNSQHPIVNNSRPNPQHQSNNANHNQIQTEKRFKDFEEEKGGKKIGEGIKQIPSYKCPIAYDELNKLREEFWNSKKTNRRIWAVLKECCSTDAGTAAILLDTAEMACLEGDLRQVFHYSNQDLIFKVPNFCIEDPMFERNFKDIKKKKGKMEEAPMSIVLYYLAKNENVNINVTNKTPILDVKKQFANKMKIDMENNAIRLLFKGQELKDEHMLYYHNVENDSKIQVMVRPLDM